MLECVRDVFDRYLLLLGKPEDQAGVDRARARGHDEPLERREAHRRVHRVALDDGGQGGACAQVARDHADARAGVSHELDRASPGVAVTQPVEAKATHVPPCSPFEWHGVRGRRFGQARVEGGIEAPHRRHVAQALADDVGGPKTSRLMEGRHGDQRSKRFGGGRVQARRTGEIGTRRERSGGRPRRIGRVRSARNRLRAAGSNSPRTAGRSSACNSWSSALRTRNLRLEDPAFTISRFMARLSAPYPVGDLGGILAVHAGIGAGLESCVLHLLAESSGPLPKARNTVDDVNDQVKAVDVVEHRHVEGSRSRALFLDNPVHAGWHGWCGGT